MGLLRWGAVSIMPGDLVSRRQPMASSSSFGITTGKLAMDSSAKL
jgi:hypothetical protein